MQIIHLILESTSSNKEKDCEANASGCQRYAAEALEGSSAEERLFACHPTLPGIFNIKKSLEIFNQKNAGGRPPAGHRA